MALFPGTARICRRRVGVDSRDMLWQHDDSTLYLHVRRAVRAVLCALCDLRGVCRSVFYLLKVKGVANAAQAAFMVSGLEIGGLAGSLLAGRIADSMVNNAKDPINEGNVGKRVQARPPAPAPSTNPCSSRTVRPGRSTG